MLFFRNECWDVCLSSSSIALKEKFALLFAGNCALRLNLLLSLTEKRFVSSCQNQFEIHFSNYENLQKLNQKTASYLHLDEADKKETFNEQEKKEFHELVGDVLNTPKKIEEKNFLENVSDWKEKVTNKEGAVPANLREQIFLSNRKIEELDKADIPALVPKEEQTLKVEKKKKEKSNFFVGVIILTLFILVFVAYIYSINK